MEHRLSKKGAINTHSIKAAGQFIVEPGFHRMGESESVEVDVTFDNLFTDPGFGPLATSSHHLLECRVYPDLKEAFFQGFFQAVRDMKRLQEDDSTWIRRKPGDLSVLHRHRKYPRAIGFQKEGSRDDLRSTSLVHKRRSCQLTMSVVSEESKGSCPIGQASVVSLRNIPW